MSINITTPINKQCQVFSFIILILFFNILRYMIDLKHYVTANNSYPTRLNSPELTDEVVANINRLLDKVNNLLKDLDVSATVSSGFRPSTVNAKIANAAKKSGHMIGKSIDLHDDKDQTLAKLIQSKPELLKKWGLWLEDPASTKGSNSNWCHLDFIDRTDRPSRMFKP